VILYYRECYYCLFLWRVHRSSN